jgi:hypothetical protein
MYVYLVRDQDKKEREALLKALSYQSRPISSKHSPFHLFSPLGANPRCDIFPKPKLTCYLLTL